MEKCLKQTRIRFYLTALAIIGVLAGTFMLGRITHNCSSETSITNLVTQTVSITNTTVVPVTITNSVTTTVTNIVPVNAEAQIAELNKKYEEAIQYLKIANEQLKVQINLNTECINIIEKKNQKIQKYAKYLDYLAKQNDELTFRLAVRTQQYQDLMKKWWSISALKAQISNIKTQEWEAKKKAWHDSGKLEGGNKGYIYKKQ